ncbi:MAG TPA: DUF4129 domain-containing protein [Streptosporangiaceae bacterium]|nr:DUF4129 domain-containing protein [Streptosporangiaceae bacterium]
MGPNDVRRGAAVAVLLGVVAIGLKSRGSFSRAGNATATAFSGSALAITLAVTEGFALVAYIVVLVSARRKRKDQDDETEYLIILRWWLKPPLFLLALAVLAVPPYLLYTHRRKGPIQVQPAPHAGLQPGTQHHAAASAAGLVSILVGVGVAVGALLAIAVYARVRSRANRDEADPARRGLAQRLAAATDALHGTGDPRQAIIACYAELERGFAAAGSAPRGADTPAEVLARAASAGLIRSRSAADLTGLFRRARYGTEPMTAGDAATAELSLDHMRAELDGRP